MPASSKSAGPTFSSSGDKRTQVQDIQTALRLARNLQERTMAKTKTSRYDVAEHLRTPEEMAAYLEACLEEAQGVYRT
jgi:hypothetical protein